MKTKTRRGALLLLIAAAALTLLTGCPPPTTTDSSTHTVTYDGNGSDGGTVPTDAAQYAEGATVTVADAGTMTLTDNVFDGWNTAADGSGTAYAAAATFAMGTADVTLYAQWIANTHTVTYDGNGSDGGTVPTDAALYTAGATVTVAGAGTMTRTGYAFDGWNTAADGSGTAYAAAATFAMGTADVTLYAQWIADYFNVNFTTIGGTANGYAQDGDHGSSDVPGITLYFIGVTTSGSGYFKVYDTGGSPAAGVSGSDPATQAFFGINSFNAAVDFSISSFSVYNPGGTPVSIQVDGWAGTMPWPPSGTGDVVTYTTSVAAGGWATVNLTGFTGISSLTIDFADTTPLYFNNFSVLP
ncbi:MAG: InlB B-repeat-containing protein [Spirochaetales bacterium]|nr:InlB B-repeat-containing protein [Spirochaetales bacterium]